MILAKHPPEVPPMGEAEDTKLQLGQPENGKAKASQKRAGQKHTTWLRVKTGHHFNRDIPFRALVCQLGRLPSIQHTIKALPGLGAGPRAMLWAPIES